MAASAINHKSLGCEEFLFMGRLLCRAASCSDASAIPYGRYDSVCVEGIIDYNSRISAPCRRKGSESLKSGDSGRESNSRKMFSTAPSRHKGAQMESVINDYISHEIVRDPARLPSSDEASPPEGAIFDPLSLLRLVVFPEENFKIKGGEADLLPENFDDANASCACLRAREPGKHGAAHG